MRRAFPALLAVSLLATPSLAADGTGQPAPMDEACVSHDAPDPRPACRFADSDGDGEHDATDLCPTTAPGAGVDGVGCSQEQFCASIEIHHWRDARFCRFVDWRNDEMFSRARDCRLSDTDAGFVCVSR